MKAIDFSGKKDMGDLNQDIVDVANTTKEIIQDRFRDTRSDAEDAKNAVDEQIHSAVEKTKDAAAEIRSGSVGVAREVKQAAIKVARAFTGPNEADAPARTDDPPNDSSPRV